MCYIIRMKSEKNNTMKKESIFTVTFTDGGEVFISARDEAHARRIIANNGLWHRNTEDIPFERTIKKLRKTLGRTTDVPPLMLYCTYENDYERTN